MGLHCLLQCVYSSVILGNYLQQTTSAEIEMIFSDAFVLDVLMVNKITTKVVYICRLLKKHATDDLSRWNFQSMYLRRFKG